MTDDMLLERLDGKMRGIRDRVRAVTLGISSGFYLWGPGGTSKTFTVEQTLKALNKPYVLTNSRITGKGLFELLDECPDVIHVLDDVETLFSDKNAYGVLRSALWGQERRLITWQTAKDGRREVVFTGGIIMLANSPLEQVPALKAIATRIPVCRYQPTNEELGAMMRRMAADGFSLGQYRLQPEHCLEVADEVIQRSAVLNRGLDLRLFVNGCRDRIQHDVGAAETHWKDLLESRIQQRVVTPHHPASPLKREQEVLREIASLPREQRVEKWKQETGKSQATMYRRLGQLSQDSQIENN